MSTLVAPLDHPQAEAEFRSARRSAGPQDRTFAAALVSGCTLFAFAVHGYHPNADDGGLYVAGIQHLLDPSLYPHSLPFVLEPTRFSIFAPAIALIVRLSRLSLSSTLLALHLATVWATLFAGWRLAACCYNGRTARAGAVVLLACWIGLPVAGTALVLMDPYLTARSFSTPCTLFALAAAIDLIRLDRSRRQKIHAFSTLALSLVLATAMHPLMAAYTLDACLMVVCCRSSNSRVRAWSLPAFSGAALQLAACFQLSAQPESEAYRRIALTRSYWFPFQWSWYESLGLAAPLAILAFFAWRRSVPAEQSTAQPAPQRALARMAVALGTTAWLVAAVFARAGASAHVVARLQPLRAFHIVYLVMVVLLGARLGESLLRRSHWRWAATSLLLGGIFLAVSFGDFPASSHIEWPGVAPQNPWIEAFLWIRANTPVDSLFALDADYINSPGEDAQCFRAIAQRSSLPDYSKDGGEASIAPQLTAEWQAGQQAQQQLSSPATTDAMRLASLQPLGVSWIVLQVQAVTQLPCSYSNGAVKVCRLDRGKSD